MLTVSYKFKMRMTPSTKRGRGRNRVMQRLLAVIGSIPETHFSSHIQVLMHATVAVNN